MKGDEMGAPANWPPRWADITDPRVLAAVRAVKRHSFVPASLRRDAYHDIPLPIGHDQTISQPYIVALMTQALHLDEESRVLEIGTGSGYQAAILCNITRHVWSVEMIPELADAARLRLRRLGYDVHVKSGDGRRGWAEHAPYDAVIVTAAAPDVPPALIAQLSEGGRLVIPVGADSWCQVLWLIRKVGGELFAERLADVRFVPLVSSGSPTEPESDAEREIQGKVEELLGAPHELPRCADE